MDDPEIEAAATPRLTWIELRAYSTTGASPRAG